MALIKCKECGKEISSLAKTCPSCGCPIAAGSNQQNQSSNFVLDNSNNYLEMAKSALAADNFEESIKYANKLIEINTENLDGWFIKGQATLLSGTVSNPRFKEAIYCFSNILNKKNDNYLFRCDIAGTILDTYNGFQEQIKANKKGAFSQALISGAIDVVTGDNSAQDGLDQRNANIATVEELRNQFSAYVIPFVEQYNLQWEFSLFLSERPVGNTEEELRQNVEKIREDINSGQTENYYQKFLNQIKPKNGCYIATAVYSSYDCPEVWVLRRFRDFYLRQNILGKNFVKLYYATSPALVKKFGKTKIFTSFWKGVLDKFVVFLKEKGISDKPYND